MAYADPPYIGQAKKHYANHPDFAGEVDHNLLIERLMDEFQDGWALSCSSPSLKIILPMCPEKTRVMAWTRTYASLKPGVWPCYAWEPVLMFGGRKAQRDKHTPNDWLLSSPGTQHGGFIGGKPPAFCWWVFDCLGLLPDDDFYDLFPGSGAVWRAWEAYKTCLVPSPRNPIQQLSLTDADVG